MNRNLSSNSRLARRLIPELSPGKLDVRLAMLRERLVHLNHLLHLGLAGSIEVSSKLFFSSSLRVNKARQGRYVLEVKGGWWQ